MILLFKNLKEILDEELSVSQIGIIVTLALCGEKIPAFTEAKFKLFVDYKKHKKDLVYLHENGFIKWSKYNYYKKKIEQDNSKIKNEIYEAIKFMNDLYNRNFDHESKSCNNLKARLKEYSMDDIKLVIANRYEEWKGDNVMVKNLNPITIFRAGLFSKYLEEAQRTSVGKGIMNVSKLGLQEGDEITHSLSRKFIDTDIYTFKTFQTSSNGERKGNGKTESNTGRAIKILLNVQNNLIKNGNEKEFIYIFVKK